MQVKSALALAILLVQSSLAAAQEPHKLGPDPLRHDRVPQGTATQMPARKSATFPRTVRDWWLYVPAQYDDKKPACVMIFQDGGGYVSEKGSFRTPIVFDNLIHKKEMPVTIGIFLQPGTVPGSGPGK